MKRNRGKWTKNTESYFVTAQSVLNELHSYWPVTLRQVYYQLVAAGHIPNKHSAYQKLSRILTRARLDGRLSWSAIEDRARSKLHSSGWDNAGEFVKDELSGFLSGYRRDVLRDQDIALELWIEKDALSHICHDVAVQYCVPVIVARGFSSISYLHEARTRIERNAENGKRTVILYFGDMDPSGWEMLPSMLITLQEEMKLGDLVEGERCALTVEQVSKYGLLRNPDALKKTDTRAQKYIERFGDLAVELDALPPAVFEGLVREAIESKLDLSLLEQCSQAEKEDRIWIDGIHQQVKDSLENFPIEGV